MDEMTTDVRLATGNRAGLIAADDQICRSYHAIDDFRMKLLGLLPFTSVAAILLLNKDALLSSTLAGGSELFGFAAVFAAAFTLTLFVYEVRGILRCGGLIARKKEIERALGVRGQFWQCEWEAKSAGERPLQWSNVAKLFNTTVASCLVYSFVFSARSSWRSGTDTESCSSAVPLQRSLSAY
jgi:hypothetical protein